MSKFVFAVVAIFTVGCLEDSGRRIGSVNSDAGIDDSTDTQVAPDTQTGTNQLDDTDDTDDTDDAEQPEDTDTGTGTALECDTQIAGVCWYLSGLGLSCEMTCADHGGFHDATVWYTGSDGTDSACGIVLEALGKGTVSNASTCPSIVNPGAGCVFVTNLNIQCRESSATTDALTLDSASFRACACNN